MFKGASEIFHPPAEATYKEADLAGFEWIPFELKKKGGTEHKKTTPEGGRIPAIFREWKGRQGEVAWQTILYCGGIEEDLGMMSEWIDTLKEALNVSKKHMAFKKRNVDFLFIDPPQTQKSKGKHPCI